MDPPTRACSCGSPASSPGDHSSDSEVEASGPPPTPPKTERSRKRPGGPERAPPELSSSPRGGKRPRKGDGGDAPPSDGDHLFAQKCRELRGFIRPLAELLEGLKRGRYDRGLSSFQQSVAMDRIQRIIGVLQKPEMGARYLGTLLQVEGMLRVWFPHVAPKPAQDPAPSPTATAPPRRRPPAGPPGAPRCRRLPGDVPSSNPTGTSGTSHRGGHPKCQTGTPVLAPHVPLHPPAWPYGAWCPPTVPTAPQGSVPPHPLRPVTSTLTPPLPRRPISDPPQAPPPSAGSHFRFRGGEWSGRRSSGMGLGPDRTGRFCWDLRGWGGSYRILP
uniref:Circadian-associated transcriptional repressor n=1 Tax=Accipiter nisus TaxID=211598 RepID=A0A8B9M522_9AVES